MSTFSRFLSVRKTPYFYMIERKKQYYQERRDKSLNCPKCMNGVMEYTGKIPIDVEVIKGKTIVKVTCSNFVMILHLLILNE